MAVSDFVTKQENSPYQSGNRVGFRIISGFGAGASGAVTGLSAGRGDKLIYVGALSTNTVINITKASVSISATRVVIATVATTGRSVFVMWWRGDDSSLL